ncbi:hypothetical protein D6764_05250 [Candidatus Woesearchaeota archaeon]|nr:MAG: hypothetical protein D6764_05250 [Candidatus Woesearchaeota archaeon]
MALLEFVMEYKWVLLFYSAVAILIYKNRKKFDFQAKFIALLRTKIGFSFLERQSKKNGSWWKLFGYVAIGAGFIGMIIISVMLVDSLWKLITVPDSPPGVAPIIPGIKIPGSPIFVPLWYGIISLFFVVLVHEAAHGLVAKSHGIPVKSTGIVFFGPLIGAFVEPDEKKLAKKGDVVQYSVFAAGPFSNVVLAVIVALVLNLLITPVYGLVFQSDGFTFEGVQEGYPAEAAGIKPGMVFTEANGAPLKDANEFLKLISVMKPNETLVLNGTNGTFSVTLTKHPEEPYRGYMGVTGLTTHTVLRSDSFAAKAFSEVLVMIATLLKWILILSLGIGLANLLPIGPVDGGRMLLTALQSLFPKEKAELLWRKISMATLLIILLNLFWPAFRWLNSAVMGVFVP